MTLQVLINHYKENEFIVRRFLRSLEMQKDVEFSVMLCSDGGEKLSEEFLSQFNLKIQYLYLEHSGVCHVRNIMMDKSNADYIMFADVDDCFTSSDGLYALMYAAEKTGADIVGSPYLAETIENNEYAYKTYYRDTVRVHGKIFKKSFLVENNIRYPDELETSGDMMFTWLAYSLAKEIIWLKNNFYVWKFNPDSVTRGIAYEPIKHYSRTLKCFSLLADDLIERQDNALYQKLVSVFIPMMYLDTTSDLWAIAPEDLVKEANEAAVIYVDRFLEDYKQLDDQSKEVSFQVEFNCKPIYNKDTQTIDKIIPWAEQFLKDYSYVLENVAEEIEEDERILKDVLIIGHGVVGSNLEKELEVLHPDIYDKYKNIDDRSGTYKIAFICVDTPKTDNSLCDISEIKNAILENDAEIYVIKSTILPGTTNEIIEETGKNVIFSPEYYGGTQHCNNYNFDFTILGGNRESCKKVIQILQKVYDGRHQFRITDSKTAELVKYMENSYLATKVSFCNQFYNIAKEVDVSYEELRELFILDPRVNSSHTFVYEDKPYWDSHCLNKDVPAIAEEYDAKLLKSIIEFNDGCKYKRQNG